MAKSNAATQQFVNVSDIKGSVVLLKDGQMCSVLIASSLNFALKSADEQQAILQQFQSMLNTLDFTIQIYVQSRKLNIEPYLGLLQELGPKQNNDLMRIQLREYIEFIRSFTEEVDVMNKNFFIVIPYSPAKVNLKSTIKNFFGGQDKSAVPLNDSLFEEHRNQLEQRVTIIEQGLARVGVRTVALQKDELVEFFYHIYNPGDISGTAPTMN